MSEFALSKKIIVIALGVLFSAFLSYIFFSDAQLQKGFFILFVCAGLWMTEIIPLAVTALLVPVISYFLKVLDAGAAMAPFSSTIIYLFMGGFTLAALLQKHGIDRWLANAVIGITKGRVWLSVIGFFAVTSFLSMWMSNTATTAMMIPIAVALVGSEYPKMRTMLILGTAYAANIGGNGTMVGSPPNGIAVSALDIDFFEWFAVGFPTMLILFPFVIFSLWIIIRPESKIALNKVENVDFEWTPRAKGTVVLFAFTVVCWIFSRYINELLGLKNFDRMIAILITAIAPMLGLISWKDLEKKIGWGILLLFGGGLCLSKVLTETGTTKFLAESLFLSISGSPTWIVIIACIAVMIFLTEISSNTGSAAIFIPIMIALSDQFSGSVTFALVFGVGLAANCAFMLPVATPPNAIVYGTGYIQQKYMIRAGFLLNIISILVVFLVVSLLLS